MKPFNRVSLGVVTASAMTIATFPVIIFSVLASSLIDEFGISRAQVGALVTASGLVGAALSPWFGRVTDRIGPISATRSVLAIGIVTLAGLAVAPTYLAIVAAAFATGIPNGWSNPATNSLIVDAIPIGSRGVVTGIKQSGVQIGTFLGGALLPFLTGAWGWRAAVSCFAVIPVAGLVVLGRRRQAREVRRSAAEHPRLPLPVSVRWVALYGALSGLATSAMFGFLPLFAEEDQGWTAATAGSLVAVTGLMGVIARIAWPHMSERWIGHGRTLRILALLTSVSAVLLLLAAAEVLGSWILVPAAVMLGGGAIAWNAVGMLAVMDFTPQHMVGRGTGLVLLGFLLGLAGGAPLLGLSVDALGSYVPGWAGTTALLLACVVVAGRIPPGSTLPAK
jgi:predicted MFS family arabinose efflux permease